MGISSRIRAIYLSHFSKPVGDRVLYRALRGQRPTRLLEIGLASPDRTLRMIDLARRLTPNAAVRYAAIDLFEARPRETPGLSLKDAHRLLKPTQARVQLIPGDPRTALARAANSLREIDLVLISAEHDEQSLAAAWFYIPRMLHARSHLFVESRDGRKAESTLQLLDSGEIERRAGTLRKRRAA